MLQGLNLRRGVIPASGSGDGASTDDRLKGKTIQLDNTRAQSEQQRQGTRLKCQLLRKRMRFAVSSVPEEGDRATMRQGRGSYADYIPLHEAWVQYFRQHVMGLACPAEGDPVIELSSSSTIGVPNKALALEKRVLAADLHGCLLHVIDSRNKPDIGIHGIVIRESKSAFHIITKKKSSQGGERRRGGAGEDKVKILPKVGRKFAFELAGHRLILHGSGLVDRMEVLASPLDGKGGKDRASRLLKTTVL